MFRNHKHLCDLIEATSHKCISYSQLKRIMNHLDYHEFNTINENYFGKTIIKEELVWYAIDGKELRGTIDKETGQRRNENIVNMVNHKTKESKLIDFYDGSKDSEKTVVKDFINSQDCLDTKGYSLDALHTSEDFLRTVNSHKGKYLAQVKGNQKFLLKDCQHTHANLPANYSFACTEKGHGRIEERKGFLYQFPVVCLDSRWETSGICTLIVVERTRTKVKTGRISTETAYHISNVELTEKNALELFNAVRNHWQIEADNNIRDTNFGEDKVINLRSTNSARTLAVCISWVLNLIRPLNFEHNLVALREEISTDLNLIQKLLVPKYFL
jgi:predicted transposase YbfD/YdcC